MGYHAFMIIYYLLLSIMPEHSDNFWFWISCWWQNDFGTVKYEMFILSILRILWWFDALNFGPGCSSWATWVDDSPQIQRQLPATLRPDMAALGRSTGNQAQWQSQIFWVNYNISLTWIKAIWGWFPILTIIPVRSQWGRYNLPRNIGK